MRRLAGNSDQPVKRLGIFQGNHIGHELLGPAEQAGEAEGPEVFGQSLPRVPLPGKQVRSFL